MPPETRINVIMFYIYIYIINVIILQGFAILPLSEELMEKNEQRSVPIVGHRKFSL